MRRRAFLHALGGAGAGAIAGCAADGDGGGEPEVSERSPRGTPTAPPGTSTGTPKRGGVPEDRVVTGEAVSSDELGVRADRWFGLERLRYREGGETRTVTADDGWFVAYEFTVRNRGQSGVGSLPDHQFHLWVDGETYAHVHEFPGGVPFDALDQPPDQPTIRPIGWYSGLDAGDSASLQLVFAPPLRRDYRHYLEWDHDTAIEGADEPVYLLGERVEVG